MNDSNDIKVIGLFDNDGHLKPDILEKLKNGELNGDALLGALDHIADCPKCADIYASSFCEKKLVEPPRGFEEELQSKITRRKENSKKDFRLYVFKVAVAASIAIVLTFSGTVPSFSKYYGTMEKANAASSSFFSGLNQKFSNLSQSLISTEVFNHATQKK